MKYIKYLSILVWLTIACNNKDPQPVSELGISNDESVTFKKNIQPLIRNKCTPCHVNGGDRSNKYDDYNTLKTLITGVMGRVIKAKDDPLFMPKNGEKLTKAELELLNKWIDQGLLEN